MQKQKRAVSKKTEKILLRILDYLKEEPRRLEMGDWGKFLPKDAKYVDGVEYDQVLPPCKTVSCLAGTCLLATKQGQDFLKKKNCTKNIAEKLGLSVKFPDNTPNEAARILGITKRQSDKLFYFRSWLFSTSGWPEEFEIRYRKAKTARGRFTATKARVLHFIETGE